MSAGPPADRKVSLGACGVVGLTEEQEGALMVAYDLALVNRLTLETLRELEIFEGRFSHLLRALYITVCNARGDKAVHRMISLKPIAVRYLTEKEIE